MGVQCKSGCGKWKLVIEGLAEHGQPSGARKDVVSVPGKTGMAD